MDLKAIRGETYRLRNETKRLKVELEVLRRENDVLEVVVRRDNLKTKPFFKSSGTTELKTFFTGPYQRNPVVYAMLETMCRPFSFTKLTVQKVCATPILYNQLKSILDVCEALDAEETNHEKRTPPTLTRLTPAGRRA